MWGWEGKRSNLINVTKVSSSTYRSVQVEDLDLEESRPILEKYYTSSYNIPLLMLVGLEIQF